MSEQITIEWPQADADALFAAMEKARRELNYDYPHSLRAGMKAVLQAVGTSTRVAPKRREITNSLAIPPRKNLKAFDITGYFGKPRKLGTRTIFAESKRNAIKYHGTIGNRGLAKRTWSIAGKMFGASVMASAVKSYTDKLARNNVDVTKNYTGENQFIQVSNGLPYIEAAIDGGPNAINTAMQRAASGMLASVDRQIAKRMGAK